MSPILKLRVRHIADEVLEVSAVCAAFVLVYGGVLSLFAKWFVVPFYPVTVNPLVLGFFALSIRFLFAQSIAVDAGRTAIDVQIGIVVRAALGLLFGFVAHLLLLWSA